MAQAYYRPDVDSPNAPMGGKVCGKRNPDTVIEARRQRLYKRQLEGLTTRQLVLDHASKENIGVETAWRDWRQVKEWNDEDWEKDRKKHFFLPGRVVAKMGFRGTRPRTKKGYSATHARM